MLCDCLLPSASKISDSPPYEPSETIWFTGTKLKGDSVKTRREVREVMIETTDGDPLNVDHLEYGVMLEDVAFGSTWAAASCMPVCLFLFGGMVKAVAET